MLSYISLFSSAGIGCFGLKSKGFECAATSELIERRINIQRINNKCKYDSGYVSGDITDPNIKEQLFAGINDYLSKEKKKKIDLVIATPPCQGMSVANHKKNNELKRNSLVVESIQIVNKLKPRFFIFENVSSFMKSICTDIDGSDKEITKAISENLSSSYLIAHRVINFKHYGANSSRTRTLVIGVNRDEKHVTPYDLFPSTTKPKTLKQVIGHLPKLKTMGEFDPNDFYHSFRPYKEHMLPWIEATEYGKSAFDNKDPKRRPHQVINGELVFNKNKNGDKYKRQRWESVAPCIHTRNDCLPSQNTVHPIDNRVFSIRELMLMMNIPKSFKWVRPSDLPKNSSSYDDKFKFRKKTEFNIRQCIGEAVPTIIFSKIAKNISHCDQLIELKSSEINKLLESENLYNFSKLKEFVRTKHAVYSRNTIYSICELANSKRLETAAFYTKQSVCFDLIEPLPAVKNETVRILEPSVGVGNFLFQVAQKYFDKKVIIDCVDIDRDSLELCKILTGIYLHKNITLNFIEHDFLKHKVNNKYDVAIGNPPYMQLRGKAHLLKEYRSLYKNKKTNNLFAFFIEKCIDSASIVSLVVPKAVLNAPEYKITRELMSDCILHKIYDFNEKAFDVKIETIGFLLHHTKRIKNSDVIIHSYQNKSYFYNSQNYITESQFDSWFLYRNDFFDSICKKLKFGIFKVYRDRQLTKRNTYRDGPIRVIKSRNIGDNKIIDIDGYDRYIKEINGYSVGKFLNSNAILVPNLTYNPRAARLPKNSVADGSAAILITNCNIKKSDLSYFASEEFKLFYRIARNYSTRSMNIDSVSVNFFGIKQQPKDKNNDNYNYSGDDYAST